MNTQMSNDCAGILRDGLKRQINYLRLSITDRCNFRCLYCLGSGRQKFIPHDEILRYEEIMRVLAVLLPLGVQKVRLTGGEPLARKDAVPFMARLRERWPELQLALTTNASLLAPWIPTLAQIEPVSINVSLDSLDAGVYESLTGRNELGRTLANIDRMLEAGLRVKINAVAMKGVTLRELDGFLDFIHSRPVDMRFIEFMPMGANSVWSETRYLPIAELKRSLGEKVELQPVESVEPTAGPARIYKPAGYAGRLGFISAVSDHFCATCNRLRLTAAGDLRTCLFSDRQYPLAPLLRNPRLSEEELKHAILQACQGKPLGNELLANKTAQHVAAGQMVGIGG